MFRFPAVYLFAILFTLMVTPAQATLVARAFVASYGLNTNTATNCADVINPCRHLSVAVDFVDTNGEVVVLDSGNYGLVTLTRSISLTAAPGVYAGMTAGTGRSGVIINPGTVNVVLRGLTINGLGGDNGVLMNSNGNLSIENCVISNFSGGGQRGVLVNSAATVRMVNTLIRDNDTGFELQGGATAIISKSRFLGNSAGILANGAASTTTATVRDTIVTGGINGILAFSEIVGANNRIYVIRSTISNSFAGVSAGAFPSGTSSVTISKSMVTGNSHGLFTIDADAIVKSYGNNTITNNTANTTGPVTLITPM
ncbi:right-handed parallel beta-helix repeat-containing protein [Candidatus Nitrotoga sp. 1052]|uniref:right-handed parallel beta-helix repeat-containing protein n=1 Tax=Candidatus Nitrotoga sp. 1052 TaxID=2886964 RepID=UPI001EF71DD6|nr:right-handed parallel beta-helix repeat-containing protein [Candidatus Nitrotoga sp. 1052]CAH1079343.1 Beta_helix domain-containing protein [Candidatus Nitrotoga sp. 1052]